MHHRAIKATFKEGSLIEVSFANGKVKQYDISKLFDKYPQLKALEEPSLFGSGKLLGSSGIIWNDELDIDIEEIYQNGITVSEGNVSPTILAGEAVAEARTRKGLTQKELADASGIDQSDISKIERGAANPSVKLLGRIAEALGAGLTIRIETMDNND